MPVPPVGHKPACGQWCRLQGRGWEERLPRRLPASCVFIGGQPPPAAASGTECSWGGGAAPRQWGCGLTLPPRSLQVAHRFRELMTLFHTACDGSSEDEEDAASTSNADQLSDKDPGLSEEEPEEPGY